MTWEAATWLIVALALVLCCVSMFAMMARSRGSARRSIPPTMEGQRGTPAGKSDRAGK